MPAASRFCPNCGSAVRQDEAATGVAGRDTPVARGPADPDDATRFVPADDALTVAARPASDDALTMAASSDHAVTIASVSDSLADAMTTADPVTPTARSAGAARGRRRTSGESGPLEVGQSFGPRYHIIRLLGAGGMGAVYQAWDAELGVAVAIKVIRPDVMDDPATAEEVSRRFKRELLLARQVTHKNVVRIHDLGDIDGIKYITMSYVEGTDLSSILKKDGKRPVPDLLRIARAVISGLVAAHAAGVVHRDLKPANIMIDKDGEALIMDFGIAHSTGDAAAAPKPGIGQVPEHLTRAGAHHAATTLGSIVGTVEYMAPEQAKGQAIDQRVDVYAFGLILYDALLGQRRASSGAAAVEELQRRMAAPPPPLQALNSAIPPPLAALVARCVEPEADKRFQSSADVAAEFERLDDEGHLVPIRRALGLPHVAAIVAVLTLVFGSAWWYFREPLPVEHAPVTVLISDFTNTTGDAALNGTLEPMMRLALMEAGFIEAIDRTQMRARLAVPAPDVLDERAATETAAKEGVGIVLAGSIARSGGQFELAVKAIETVTGKELIAARERARTRDQVLAAATSLAIEVREALGDDTSDSTRRFAADTLSATSIEVVRNYAAAMEAQADGRFEDALTAFKKALDGDPNFGLAYAGMASSSRNLEKFEDAEEYAKEAARHVDRMTERERYRARGLVSMATGDYVQCLEDFGKENGMLKRYAADVVAHNNVAFCQTQLRQMSAAVESMRRATEILPKRALYRLNLALYEAYASNFPAAETDAVATQELGNTLGLQPLAYAQVGQDRIPDAIRTYEALMKTNPQGASIAASGLADIAVYEGRFAEAARLYEAGAKTDLERKNPDRAAAKLAGLAYAEQQRGRTVAARAAATAAIKTSQAIRSRLHAARVLVDIGDIADVRVVATQLASEPQPEAQASATILLGTIAARSNDYAGAITLLTDANKQLDTWMGQFELGRARLAAGQHNGADSAFDRCVTRSGELFLDEEPTYGRLPMVLYLQGQAREAAKSIGFADLYRRYLRIREKAGEDPLLNDVRRRAGL